MGWGAGVRPASTPASVDVAAAAYDANPAPALEIALPHQRGTTADDGYCLRIGCEDVVRLAENLVSWADQ